LYFGFIGASCSCIFFLHWPLALAGFVVWQRTIVAILVWQSCYLVGALVEAAGWCPGPV